MMACNSKPEQLPQHNTCTKRQVIIVMIQKSVGIARLFPNVMNRK